MFGLLRADQGMKASKVSEGRTEVGKPVHCALYGWHLRAPKPAQCYMFTKNCV